MGAVAPGGAPPPPPPSGGGNRKLFTDRPIDPLTDEKPEACDSCYKKKSYIEFMGVRKKDTYVNRCADCRGFVVDYIN